MTEADAAPEAEQAPSPLKVKVRDLPWYTPFGWIRQGVLDIYKTPHASLFYGLAFVLMGEALYQLVAHAPHHVLTLMTAFLIAGPFLCLGLYEISRRHETVPHVRLLPTLTAFRVNFPGISLYAIILALLVAGWMRVAVVVFALFMDDQLPSLDLMFSTQFMTETNLGFLLVYFGSGACFALLTFAISVVAIPLMLDRNTDTLNAMFASVRVCLANPVCMLVWALLIVGLVAIGFLLFNIGLVLTAPIVGHATWHAYRALIE